MQECINSETWSGPVKIVQFSCSRVYLYATFPVIYFTNGFHKWTARCRKPDGRKNGKINFHEKSYGPSHSWHTGMAVWEGGASRVLDCTAPEAGWKVTTALGTVGASAFVVLKQVSEDWGVTVWPNQLSLGILLCYLRSPSAANAKPLTFMQHVSLWKKSVFDLTNGKSKYYICN